MSKTGVAYSILSFTAILICYFRFYFPIRSPFNLISAFDFKFLLSIKVKKIKTF